MGDWGIVWIKGWRIIITIGRVRGERIRRKKEMMKKVLEKSVGRSEEPERPKTPAGPVEENQIGELGDEMVLEEQ